MTFLQKSHPEAGERILPLDITDSQPLALRDPRNQEVLTRLLNLLHRGGPKSAVPAGKSCQSLAINMNLPDAITLWNLEYADDGPTGRVVACG